MTGDDVRGGDQPRSDEDPKRSGAPDEAPVLPPDSLTEDELRWVAGGTRPSEDEPNTPV